MTRAIGTGDDLNFGSPFARHRFMNAARGKEVRLEIIEKPTDEMRKYFEGCLVPAFYYLHPLAKWESFADAREILKLEFSPGVREITDGDGTTFKVAPSTGDMSKARFTQFVESVVEWMMENGVDSAVLDSEEYKRWRDTNFVDPFYPPLLRLKMAYEKTRAAADASRKAGVRKRAAKSSPRRRRAKSE